jgi:hypothetical protein
MQIHTDKLTARDLYRTAPAGCFVEHVEHGSRSRRRRFDVGMSAAHGADAHGIARVYARNTGNRGADGYGAPREIVPRAATWVEWGDWIVALFKLDPGARIGHYESPASFIETTTEYAPSRPARENAPEHAARWARELNGNA